MNNEGSPTDVRNENTGDKNNAAGVGGAQSLSETNFPPTPSDCKQSDDKPKSKHARIKYYFEMAGIVFGVAGVICLVVQSCAMIQSNKVLAEQLKEMRAGKELDERAWVVPYLSDNNLVQSPNGGAYVRVNRRVFIVTFFWLVFFLAGRVSRRIIGTQLSQRLPEHNGQECVMQGFYISSLLRSAPPSACCQLLELCITIKPEQEK